MKKYFFVLFLLVNTASFAQFKLSGKINHYTQGNNLKINIPVVYGIFDQNSISIPVAKDGSFSVVVPVKSQKFATIIYQSNFYWLLLNARKTLTIALDANNKNIQIVNGTALPENTILQQVKLAEYPAFLQDDKYTHFDYNALNSQLLRPYLAACDRKIALVTQSTISPADKKLIAAEAKYATYNYLHELTDIGAENQATLNKLIADFYSKVNIKPATLPAGPQYYIFLNNYLQEREKTTKVKQNTFVSRLQSALKYLPLNAAEQLGYQLILRAFHDGDAVQGKALTDAYLQKFPKGVYAADVNKKAASFK